MKSLPALLKRLCVIGVNHRSASLELLERCARVLQAGPLSVDLLTEHSVNEAIVLTTCNRSELIFISDTPHHGSACLAQLPEWPSEFSAHAYTYQGEKALEHLIRLASGLDSMFVGEPQIFGQLKRAVERHTAPCPMAGDLNKLLALVFKAAKHIRTTCELQNGVRSLGYLIAKLIKEQFSEAEHRPLVLCIGAGEMMQDVVRAIHPDVEMIIASRTQERAASLADPYRSLSMDLDTLYENWPAADVVITATHAQQPLISGEHIRHIQALREAKPLLLFDLAVPRDIDPAARDITGVLQHDLEDLQACLAAQEDSQANACEKADFMVIAEIQDILNGLQAAKADPAIISMRQRVDNLRIEALQAAEKALQAGEPADIVIDRTLQQLCQRILHRPTQALRKAACESDTEALTTLTDLLLEEEGCE